MQAIHKVVLELVDEQIVTIDSLFQVISCQMQNRKLCVWYIVDNQQERKQQLNFQIIGTGNPCKLDIGHIHLSTVQQDSLVWHVFYSFVITKK